MSTFLAYALREDAEVTAMTVSVPDGTQHDHVDGDLFDVKAALDAGNGVVVIDTTRHSILAEQLRVQPALEQVDVPDGYTPPEPPLVVDPAVAGLSGAANEGHPVDAFGQPYATPADVPDDAQPPDPPLPEGHVTLDTLSIPQLEAYAAELAEADAPVAVDLSGASKKKDIVDRFRAAGVLSAPIMVGD